MKKTNWTLMAAAVAITAAASMTTGFVYAGGEWKAEKEEEASKAASKAESKAEYEHDNVTRSAARGYDPERIRGDKNVKAHENSEEFEAEEEGEFEGGWMRLNESEDTRHDSVETE